MVMSSTNAFEDLIGLAGKFVKQQKGLWDYDGWISFLSDIQQKGVEITSDIQTNMGIMLESMKKFHNATTKVKGMQNSTLEIAKSAGKFIKDTKGVWDHEEWESFLKELQKKGVNLNDEMIIYIGNVLESAKGLYNVSEMSKEEKH